MRLRLATGMPHPCSSPGQRPSRPPHNRLCDIPRSQPASTEAELLELQPPGLPLAIVTGTLPIFGQLPPGTTDEHLNKNNSESVPCRVQVS